MFDLNGDGEVDYNELMRCVVGEMNPMRKDIVKKAFKKLDKDASGIVELSDL